MRYSLLFGKTVREAPQAARSESHALLHRGGFVRQMGQGLVACLPLGMRVLQNLQRVISEEMAALGGQEIYAPVVTPAEIWRRSGRLGRISELISFEDRHGRQLVLSPTHEEAFLEVVRSALASYREMPLFLYQFQIKFRDEEHPRDGIARTKEIYMHDAYSFHRSYQDLNNFFPRTHKAYQRVFDRCGIQTYAGQAGVGYIGGERSYEFLMPTEAADHAIILCDRCGYCASKEVAVGGKHYLSEEPKPLHRLDTPGCSSIEELCGLLQLPRERLAKSLVLVTPDGLVMAVIRGDYELAVEKLSACLKVPVFRMAADEELRAAGLVPGFLSPIGLPSAPAGPRVVVDDAVARSGNLVFGANQPDQHLANGNFGRDFDGALVADISLTHDARVCLQCGGTLREIQALEVGHIFKLGDFYCRAMNLTYQDEKGAMVHPHMGCYGVGLGRLMDAVVRSNHDERGILWPAELAPFLVHLMGVGKALSVRKAVETLHEELGEKALYDDREEYAGVKFADADLIGAPLRVVVSARHLAEGKVELKERRGGEVRLVAPARLPALVAALRGGGK
jgi:prolyl-tRNA synthetase